MIKIMAIAQNKYFIMETPIFVTNKMAQTLAPQEW